MRGRKIVTDNNGHEYLIPAERDDEWDQLCDDGLTYLALEWAEPLETTDDS